MCVVLTFWLGGIVWFLRAVPWPVATHEEKIPSLVPPQADAVVVLSGGPTRLATGVDILEQGLAPRLFYSGVHPRVPAEDVLRASNLPHTLTPKLRQRIEMGRSATNTWSNALETARWARHNHLQSLILVTSFYHIPRSSMALQALLPDVRIVPYPVPPSRPVNRWTYGWILIKEFHKTIFLWARLCAEDFWFSLRKKSASITVTAT